MIENLKNRLSIWWIYLFLYAFKIYFIFICSHAKIEAELVVFSQLANYVKTTLVFVQVKYLIGELKVC